MFALFLTFKFSLNILNVYNNIFLKLHHILSHSNYFTMQCGRPLFNTKTKYENKKGIIVKT